MISNPTELSVSDNVVLPVPVSKPRKKVVYDVLPSYESQEPVVPATAETDPAGLVSVLIEAANTKPVIQAPGFRKKKAITVKEVVDPVVDPSEKPKTKKPRVPKKTPQPIVVSDPVVIEFKDELKEDNYVAPSGVPLVDDTDEEILVETILIHGKTYYIAQDNRLFSLSLNLVGVFHENKDDGGGFIQYYSKDNDNDNNTTPI